MSSWQPTISSCDQYLSERTGCYQYRKVRYGAASELMYKNGLQDSDTIYDVGAGWTELDYYLRVTMNWKGRYCPVDGALDNIDIDNWTPPRETEWFVCLEIIEHLWKPFMLLEKLKQYTTKGIIISTPNSDVVDTLAMDTTHKTPIYKKQLEENGFTVKERSFYGNDKDSLFAWRLA